MGVTSWRRSSFAVASGTDYVDGYLARRQGSTSRFGKLMDPFADKLLVIAALVCLAIEHGLAVWVVAVVAVREVAVTVSRTLASRRGTVVAAALWGKAKTMLQVVTVLLLILIDPAPGWLDALVYVMVVVTILSGLDYARGVRRPAARRRRRPVQRRDRREVGPPALLGVMVVAAAAALAVAVASTRRSGPGRRPRLRAATPTLARRARAGDLGTRVRTDVDSDSLRIVSRRRLGPDTAVILQGTGYRMLVLAAKGSPPLGRDARPPGVPADAAVRVRRPRDRSAARRAERVRPAGSPPTGEPGLAEKPPRSRPSGGRGVEPGAERHAARAVVWSDEL